MLFCGHRTPRMLDRHYILQEEDLRRAMTRVQEEVCHHFVTPHPSSRILSPQPLDFLQRRRIGAGVPPGLQIQ